MMLLTGATGKVATLLRPRLAEQGVAARVVDQKRPRSIAPSEEVMRCRLERPRECRRACAGVDTILHLAAASLDVEWSDLIGPNVTGLTNLLEAARAEGVGDFIFASTMHVFGMYPRDVPLHEDLTPAPDSRYAASKLFGEAACRLYAEKYGMAVTILRIGHAVERFEDAAPGFGILADDLTQLIRHLAETPHSGLRIVHAVAPHEGYLTSDGRLANAGFTFAGNGPSRTEILATLNQNTTLSEVAKKLHGGDFAG